MAAGKGYNYVPASLEYHRGGPSEMDRDPEGQSRRYDITSLQTYCRYAGIVLLEEKFVSNGLIDLQDMWVTDYIHIALASK